MDLLKLDCVTAVFGAQPKQTRYIKLGEMLLFILKEINRTDHEFMNVHPPQPLHTKTHAHIQ